MLPRGETECPILCSSSGATVVILYQTRDLCQIVLSPGAGEIHLHLQIVGKRHGSALV